MSTTKIQRKRVCQMIKEIDGRLSDNIANYSLTRGRMLKTSCQVNVKIEWLQKKKKRNGERE